MLDQKISSTRPAFIVRVLVHLSPEGVPCTATMDLVLALPASALLAFVVLRRRREQTSWRPRRGRDNELVCAQLEAEAEMEM